MNNREFIKLAKDEVAHYTFDVLGYEQTSIEIFVVWQVKVLQNYKALLATDIEDDQHYYEATYNGDKKELYLDVYDKQENKCFKVK
ncbi:DUF6275 family protein [Limosilactobacillus reuteri]|uniref:DUF6275 family protein n=1 Tax=Limosilactobacillus reuteri TaxID=1598 RepID=UPI00104D5419|nr:DUF6275 family protein [Limosilactobacillus reuteri]